MGWVRALGGALSALAICATLATSALAQSWNTPWRDGEIAELAGVLSETWTHGLDPARYPDPDHLRALAPGPDRDLLARAAWFQLAGDLLYGQVDPRRLNPDWSAPHRAADLLTEYAQARERGAIAAALEAGTGPCRLSGAAPRADPAHRLPHRAGAGARRRAPAPGR